MAIVCFLFLLTTAWAMAGQGTPTNAPASSTSVPVNVQATSASDQRETEAEKENLDIQRKLEWFTGGLVIVGLMQAGTMIWQASLLKGTLTQIQTQARHMESQTQILGDSVAAAQRAADAAETSAKTAMGVSVPTLAIYKFAFINEGKENPVAFYQCPRIRLELKNYGQSPAFLRKYAIGFSWGSDKTEKFTVYPFDEEQVVDAGGIYIFNDVDLGVMDSPPAVVIEDLVKGKKHLTFAGWVSYEDVFGSPIRRLTVFKALIEYDPDPAKMVILDPSPLNIALDPDDQ